MKATNYKGAGNHSLKEIENICESQELLLNAKQVTFQTMRNELTQKQNDIDELVEALIHATLGDIERIDFDNYNLLIQKHTK